MTSAERARAYALAAELLPTIAAFAGTAAGAMLRAELQQRARAEVAPVVFRRPAPGRWLVGQGDQLREFAADLAGLRAAWHAIDVGAHGPAVLAAEFAAPGALSCDRIVRRAIRVTAAQWARHAAQCPALADALGLVQVKAGRVLYRRPAGAPLIVTR